MLFEFKNNNNDFYDMNLDYFNLNKYDINNNEFMNYNNMNKSDNLDLENGFYLGIFLVICINLIKILNLRKLMLIVNNKKCCYVFKN